MDSRRASGPAQISIWVALLLVFGAMAPAMTPGEATAGRSGEEASESSPARASKRADRSEARSFIIAGDSARAVAERVEDVGGKVTHDLAIIRAIAADLTPKQLEALKKAEPELKIDLNSRVEADDADSDSDTDSDAASP